MFYLTAIPMNACPTSLTTTFNLKFINCRPLLRALTTSVLNKLLTIGDLPANSSLVTLDVWSLYTNIRHNEGTCAWGQFLRISSHVTFPTGSDLIRMILAENNFSFNDNHYLQIQRTAMGTKMAPSYANLFLGCFEANALGSLEQAPAF